MEGDAILSVQLLQLREVAELRWHRAREIIRIEVPERAAIESIRPIEDAEYSQIITTVRNHRL